MSRLALSTQIGDLPKKENTTLLAKVENFLKIENVFSFSYFISSCLFSLLLAMQISFWDIFLVISGW